MFAELHSRQMDDGLLAFLLLHIINITIIIQSICRQHNTVQHIMQSTFSDSQTNFYTGSSIFLIQVLPLIHCNQSF